MTAKYDPIIARATAAGKGGVGIIRLSGADSDLRQIAKMLYPKIEVRSRFVHFCRLINHSGQLIDETVVLFFPAPHSYTGETVLEIQCHGGPAVIEEVIRYCLQVGRKNGLRLAKAGEFTERAFLNGRIDLAQAEAVADLIDANSSAAARAAARSLQGEFSKQIALLNQKLIDLRIFVEATLDFPEENIDFIHQEKVHEKLQSIQEQFQQLEKKAMRGKVLRDGMTVVLVGAPNVGKSSLMNRLSGEEVAIVTNIAGTTRDRIESHIELDGLPINIVDTAGLRQSSDPVERIGIERTLQAVSQADVVLRLICPETMEKADDDEALSMILPCLRNGVQTLTVINKIDLYPNKPTVPCDAAISAKTGQGIEDVIAKLQEIAGKNENGQGDFLARSRHLDCLARARFHIQSAQEALETTTLDIVAEELRLAGNALGEIVGVLLPDDLLGQIFSRFCIGK